MLSTKLCKYGPEKGGIYIRDILYAKDIVSLRGRLQIALHRLNEDNNMQSVRKKISSFLDLFMVNGTVEEEHLKRKGAYRALLLGTDKLDLVWSLLGTQAKVIINGQVHYLITIERTFSSNFLSFEFGKNKITEEHERLLSKLFQMYAPHVDLKRHSDKIPGLILNDIALSLITNPSDDVRLLLESNLVERLTIGIAVDSLSSVNSLIDRLDIVPIPITGPEGLTLEYMSTMLDFFTSYSCYNFVIANNQDDYLLKIFFSMAKSYCNQFGLSTKSGVNLLRLVFHTTGDFWSHTKLFVDNPELNEILSSLNDIGCNLDSRHLVSNVICVLASTLNLIDSTGHLGDVDHVKAEQLTSELPNLLDQFLSDTYKVLDSYEQEIKNDAEKMLQATENIEQMGKQVRNSFKKKIEDRSLLINEMKGYLSELSDFVDVYCQPHLDNVLSFIQQYIESSKSYLESKTILFIKSYKQGDNEFRDWLDRALLFGQDVLTNAISQPQLFSYQIFVKKFKEIMQRYEQIVNATHGLINNDLWQLCQFIMKISEVETKAQHLFQEFEGDFNNQLKQLLPYASQMKNSGSKLRSDIKSGETDDRKAFLMEIGVYVEELLDFSNFYSPTYQGEVIVAKESLISHQEVLIEKKNSGKYALNSGEFEGFILNFLNNLDYLSEKLFNSIQFSCLDGLTDNIMTTLNTIKESDADIDIRQSVLKLKDSLILPQIKRALIDEIILLTGVEV